MASVNTPAGERLVLAGLFDLVGEAPISSMALYDGIELSTVGDVVGIVHTILPENLGFTIGGAFSSVDGVAANFVATWDGNSWGALGDGVNGAVYALCYFDDGSGEALYVGGDFSSAGGIACTGLARWNGVEWQVPAGNLDGSVRALYAFDGELWVGGEFVSIDGAAVNYVARWDGSGWSDAAGGANDRVFTFHPFDFGSGPRLLMGGAFTAAGGLVTGRTARWNGSGWEFVSGMNGLVRSFATVIEQGQSVLYVGGTFSLANSQQVRRLARLTDNGWQGLGNEMDATVWGMSSYPIGGVETLVVGGDFSRVGGERALGCAMLVDSTLQPLLAGGGVDGGVTTATFHQGQLYAAGANLQTGPNFVAELRDGAWRPLDLGLSGTPTVLLGDVAALDGDLCVAGTFQFASGLEVGHVARWDGSVWNRLDGGNGLGLDAPVTCAVAAPAAGSAALYLAGEFSSAGGVAANHIVCWQNGSWVPLAEGIEGSAKALATDGTDIYVAGALSSAGTVNVNNIARYDGVLWSALGEGVDGEVSALAWGDLGGGSSLYVGGEFVGSGSMPLDNVARWDGTGWSALGTGVNGRVGFLQILERGGTPAILVGGEFTEAGGLNVPGMALWNGVSWEPFSNLADTATINGAVATVAHAGNLGVSGEEHVVVSGDFTEVAGEVARGLAEWRFGFAPVVRLLPRDPEVCEGTFVTLEGITSGSGELQLQWLFDGIPLPGESGAELLLGPFDATLAGGYTLQVTGRCGTTTSSSVDLQPISCDCDNDSIRDLDEILQGLADDCNQNGVPDACELAAGMLDDFNVNGIPDVCEGPFLRRGDANCTGNSDLTDVISSLNYLFFGGNVCCLDALDINDSGTLGLTDPLLLLAFLFQGGNPPAEPFSQCGLDPTADTLSQCSGSCP